MLKASFYGISAHYFKCLRAKFYIDTLVKEKVLAHGKGSSYLVKGQNVNKLLMLSQNISQFTTRNQMRAKNLYQIKV